MFALDTILIFNTAFYNDEWDLIDNRKEISLTYIKSWFIIDLLAIIPFDVIIE
jgi:potassium voltage-gated channel Eag-related subfamily H protein 8